MTDPLLVGLLVGLGLLALAALWFIWRHVFRRSAAGLRTSLFARGAQVSSLLTRSLIRRLYLRMRQLVSARERRKHLEEQYHLQSAEEAARVLGEMKGVFMKLGQIVSFADHSLPEPARQALQSLQREAPPMAFSLVRQVIEADLGGDLGAFFRHLDEEPWAAASIGQVHRGRLRDGSLVAVKVQYPGVDVAIESDLKASRMLAALIGTVNRNIDADAVVAELAERLRDELDYRQEMRHQQYFHAIWQGHPLIRVPRVHPGLCTKHVLCQEFCRGLDFYEFVAHANQGEKHLAVHVLHDFVFDSIHLHHVFNGDPHPGNYLFHEDGGVTFLDFGCVKRFEPPFIGDVQGLLRALVENDRSAFDEHVMRLKLVLPGRPYNRELLWEFMRYQVEPVLEDREFTFTEAWLKKAGEVMRYENLQQLNLPADMLLFNRITFGLNAIFERLGASANFHRIIRRYLYQAEVLPPALEHAGVDLPARFRHVGGETAADGS